MWGIQELKEAQWRWNTEGGKNGTIPSSTSYYIVPGTTLDIKHTCSENSVKGENVSSLQSVTTLYKHVVKYIYVT